MTNIYELAEELETSPKMLQKWLRNHGFGSGKTISIRATREARSHFKPPLDHPMASALEERDGLGAVKRHEDLIEVNGGIRVTSRPKLKWESVERSDVDLLEMDMNSQKDFFRSLRSSEVSSSTSERSPEALSAHSIKTVSSSAPSPRMSTTSTTAQAKKSRPTKTKAQSKHSVFGTLASISPQLDSVTDRKRESTLNQAEALQQMSEGVKPLRPLNKTISASPGHSQISKQSKKSKKSKRSKKSQRDHESQISISSDPQSSPATPVSFKEMFEKPEVQSLTAQLDLLKQDLKDSLAENQHLQQRLIQLDKERDQITPNQTLTSRNTVPEVEQKETQAPTLIWEHFESFGLDAHQARFALLELLDHPQRGPELIYSLKHDNSQSLTRGFAIVCEDIVCQQVANTYARQGLIEFSEKHLCSVCQGSQARGWYKRLHLTASHTDRQKILIVGGDDHDHRQIKQLSRENHGLQWEFITGDSRVDYTSANAKVAKKSAVILWGGTHLPHAISNVVKGAADKAAIPHCALPPGKRSIPYLCASILMLWGVITEDDLDIL